VSTGRGHVLWPIKADEIKSTGIHFQYLTSSSCSSTSSLTDGEMGAEAEAEAERRCVVRSQSLLIDQLLATSSDSVDRSSNGSPPLNDEYLVTASFYTILTEFHQK